MISTSRERFATRDVSGDEFILERNLDGDVVVTYNFAGQPWYRVLPCEDGAIMGRERFDSEYFHTKVTPVLEHAGYEVLLEPEDEGEYREPPEPRTNLIERIVKFITP